MDENNENNDFDLAAFFEKIGLDMDSIEEEKRRELIIGFFQYFMVRVLRDHPEFEDKLEVFMEDYKKFLRGSYPDLYE
jgi:hypothetical protein